MNLVVNRPNDQHKTNLLEWAAYKTEANNMANLIYKKKVLLQRYRTRLNDTTARSVSLLYLSCIFSSSSSVYPPERLLHYFYPPGLQHCLHPLHTHLMPCLPTSLYTLFANLKGYMIRENWDIFCFFYYFPLKLLSDSHPRHDLEV